jgi:hypothetical protein
LVPDRGRSATIEPPLPCHRGNMQSQRGERNR